MKTFGVCTEFSGSLLPDGMGGINNFVGSLWWPSISEFTTTGSQTVVLYSQRVKRESESAG